MLPLFERLAGLFLTAHERMLQLRELKVEFIHNREAIQRHLSLCKRSGGIVGIYARPLGRGMHLVSVVNMTPDEITIKMLEEDEKLGMPVTICLDDISSVCPFNQVYEPHEPVAYHPLKLVHSN